MEEAVKIMVETVLLISFAIPSLQPLLLLWLKIKQEIIFPTEGLFVLLTTVRLLSLPLLWIMRMELPVPELLQL